MLFRSSDHCRGSSETFPKEGHVLFSIPRTLTLSTRSCTLVGLIGSDSWVSFQLHRGWSGLILCMMWEESRATQSKWHQYLRMSSFDTFKRHGSSQFPSQVSLPSQFNTPMFWSGEELDELRGASVVGASHLSFCFTRPSSEFNL